QAVTVSNIVTERPSVIFAYDPTITNGSVEVSVTTAVYGADEGNVITALRWSPGTRNAGDFSGGHGTNVTEGKFTVEENGVYTVYARDLTGLDTVRQLDVNWIVKQPPLIEHDYDSTAPRSSSIEITV